MNTSRILATRPHRRLITIGEGHYVLDAEDIGTMFHASRVRRDRNGEMRVDLMVNTGLSGAIVEDDGVLAIFDNLNLSSGSARQQAALDCERRARTTAKQVDWRGALDDLSLKVRKAEESGDGAVKLAAVVPPDKDDLFMVDDVLPFPKRHPMVWAAAGGTGKSMMALWSAGKMQQAGINVLYLDAELEAPDQRARLGALFGAHMPLVTYLRLTRPLVYELPRIERTCHEHGINYVIIDSIAMASGGAIREEETAINYNQALRSLRRGTLSITHIPKPKEAGGDDAVSIFGSVYWFNLARSVWHLKQADVAEDGTVTVGFFHRKTTMGRLQRPIGYEFRDTDGRFDVRRVDLATVDSLAKSLPLRQRIASALKSGARTIADLASDLDASTDSVKRTVNRYAGGKVAMFVKVPSTDGVDRVALAETRRAS